MGDRITWSVLFLKNKKGNPTSSHGERWTGGRLQCSGLIIKEGLGVHERQDEEQ